VPVIQTTFEPGGTIESRALMAKLDRPTLFSIIITGHPGPGRDHAGSSNDILDTLAIAEGLGPGGSRPVFSKAGRTQIVRSPLATHVSPSSRGAYFIAVGVEGIQEARFVGPNPRLHLC
jgi:hypothetical protein